MHMIAEKNISVRKIREILDQVCDPEIPVVSVNDLGIIRDVLIHGSPPTNEDAIAHTPAAAPGKCIEVIVTPTYSGCPAIDAISANIKMAFFENGLRNIKITQRLSPAWTTDWITEAGKEKLKSYGIAPPIGKSRAGEILEDIQVECPLCRSKNTRVISNFGSTACKALFQCNDCKEPFDYFKCH